MTEKSVGDMSDQKLIEGLADSQQLLGRLEMTEELVGHEGDKKTEQLGWNRGKVSLATDVFRNEIIRRLTEKKRKA